jgi:hypothetical protein
MSDFVISQIRTYIPVVIGAVVAWLVARGVLDETSSQEVLTSWTAALTAALSALYYFVVRVLASKWSWFGYLLGVNVKPEYATEDSS